MILFCVVATFDPLSRVHPKTHEVSSSDGHEPEGTLSREANYKGDLITIAGQKDLLAKSHRKIKRRHQPKSHGKAKGAGVPSQDFLGSIFSTMDNTFGPPKGPKAKTISDLGAIPKLGDRSNQSLLVPVILVMFMIMMIFLIPPPVGHRQGIPIMISGIPVPRVRFIPHRRKTISPAKNLNISFSRRTTCLILLHQRRPIRHICLLINLSMLINILGVSLTGVLSKLKFWREVPCQRMRCW